MLEKGICRFDVPRKGSVTSACDLEIPVEILDLAPAGVIGRVVERLVVRVQGVRSVALPRELTVGRSTSA